MSLDVAKIKWDEYDMGTIDLLVPLFGKEVEFTFYTQDNPRVISDKVKHAVAQVQALSSDNLAQVKDLLLENAQFCFEVTDYGAPRKDGETHLDATKRLFGIYTAEDAYSKSTLKSIHIDAKMDEMTGTYASLVFETFNRELIHIIAKNGRIIDYHDDGGWIGTYEDDDRTSHKMRQDTLEDGAP